MSGGFDAIANIRLKDLWKVNAVYEQTSDSKIIFFIGNQYWVFKDTEAMSGYPKPISDWGMKRRNGDLVDRVDAAFIWAHNGKTYLFSGGEFWRFDESQKDTRQLDSGYPRDNSLWGGMPTLMDDVISWGEGDAYFFKDNFYWVLKNGGLNQEYVAPKSTAVDWLRCPAPPVTSTPPSPRNPKGCHCHLSGSSPLQRSSFVIVFSVLLMSLCL